MARFGVNEAENYGSNGGGGYFSLKNDKDTARVRFLYDNVEDVEGFAVHEIEIDGKKRPVNCLREYGAPVSDCPFCAAKMPVRAKYYIPLQDVDNDRVVIWERGKQFGNKLSSLCARYPHLYTRVFEIERNGKAGDKETTYEIYPTDDKNENLRLEDFELPEVLGGPVMDKSAEEMQYFLDRGIFPDSTGVVRRSATHDEPTVARRTPANNGSREVF